MICIIEVRLLVERFNNKINPPKILRLKVSDKLIACNETAYSPTVSCFLGLGEILKLYYMEKKMIDNVKNFLQDEEGQSMVEYGVTLGAVAAVSYIAVVGLGDKTADLYAWMANHLPGGETGEEGTDQIVRLESDGLIQLSETADGATFDTDEFLLSGNMATTLGGEANIIGD
jgi:pilus assembly protein Flp/PilA